MSEYRVFKVTHMTCGHCCENQRVRIRLIGNVEILPHCSSCGQATWLNLPAHRDSAVPAVGRHGSPRNRMPGPSTQP